MDAIVLRPMRLTRKAYFRLLVLLRIRKAGWLYATLLVTGLFLLIVAGNNPLLIFAGMFNLLWPLVMLAWLYVWTCRKDNEGIYEERNFVLDPDKLLGTTPGGACSEVPWSYIKRLVMIDDRYLLYISAGQMIIIDREAFPDAAAEQRFRQWMAAVKA
jgi:hypothetical protein